MTSTEVVQVVIYDAPTVGAPTSGCGCGCDHHNHHGHDHTEAEDPMAKGSLEFQARALALTLETAFPGRVTVEYINVLRDLKAQGLPQTALLCSLAYPAPLVYINGRGRFAGALPVERIREEVARILESA